MKTKQKTVKKVVPAKALKLKKTVKMQVAPRKIVKHRAATSPIIEYLRKKSYQPYAAMVAFADGDTLTLSWSKNIKREPFVKESALAVAMARATMTGFPGQMPDCIRKNIVPFAMRASQRFGRKFSTILMPGLTGMDFFRLAEKYGRKGFPLKGSKNNTLCAHIA